MRKTRVLSLLLAATMIATLTACGTPAPSVSSTPPASPASASESKSESKSEEAKPAEPAAPAANEEFVKLTHYIGGAPVNDQKRIMDKANAIIKEKINAEMDLIVVDNLEEKSNLMISSGDEFDISFSAYWGNFKFWQNAADGAFVDLAPMLDKYAPGTKARTPAGLWEGVKIGQSIYAVPNYQQWGGAMRKGYMVRMDLAEEFNLDWKALKGKDTLTVLKALTPWMEQVKAKYPEMIGWETEAKKTSFFEPLYWDMDPIGDQADAGWLRLTDNKKVVNQFETPEFTDYCNLMHEWYNKNLMRKDGATLKDTVPDRKGGKIMAAPWYAWPDPIDAPPTGVKELTLQGYKDANYTVEQMSLAETPDFRYPGIGFSTTRTIMPATTASNACLVISTTSKHPERALQLIELLNTNDELFNLLQMGEENVDFKYSDKGDVTFIEGKYNFNWNEWQLGQSFSPTFGRSFFGKNQRGEDQKKKLNVVFDADKTAEASPVSGMQFNTDPIKTELVNCAAIISEVMPSLNNGALDPATAVPAFQKRLKDAGVDKIIAEKQKQLDAFYATKG